MKYLRWLFIPFLAILLMSHNTYAVDLTQDVYLVQGNFGFSMAPHSWTCYSDPTCPTWASGVYQRSFASTGANIFDISITIPNRTYTSGDWIVFDFYFFHSNTAANHSIFDGIRYEGTNYLDVVDVKVEQLTDNSAHATVYTRVYNTFTDSNLRFTGNVIMFQLQSAANAQYKAEVDAGVLTIWHERTDANYNNKLDQIVDAIENSSPSADDIADAVNAPEEQAADDISNQSTSDISTGDQSSATNLIGNISNIFTQIGNISATNCSIRANFGNLDLGNLNLCTGKENLPFVVTFGAYCFELIFVVGTSIILIKQLLGILDWSRS